MEYPKIYAKQIDPQYQDSPLGNQCEYLQEFYPGFVVCGNDYYKSSTTPEYDDLVKFAYDLYEALHLEDYRHEFKNMSEAVQYYFPVKKYHKDKTRWSTQEVHQFQWAVGNYYIGEYKSSVCVLLQLLTGHEYGCETINGCVQGEWNYCYYPKAYEASIDRLEADYFNLGSEWVIHDDEIPPKSPQDITGNYLYCYEFNIENIRQEIAERTGTTPDKVTLYQFDGYTRIPKYKEV